MTWNKIKNFDDILETLCERETIVIREIFGIDCKKSTIKFFSEQWKVSRNKINYIKRKAIYKLSRRPRNRFFAIYPDIIKEQCFGNDDDEAILTIIARNQDTTSNEIREMINTLDRNYRNDHDYIMKLKETYKELIEVLKGSKFSSYHNHLVTLAKRIESSCVNTKASLQIAQKILTSGPSNQYQSSLDKIFESLLRFEGLENRIEEAIGLLYLREKKITVRKENE